MTESAAPAEAFSARFEAACRAVREELLDAERAASSGAVQDPLRWIDRLRTLLLSGEGTAGKSTGDPRPPGYTLARQFAHDAGSPISALVVVAGSLRTRLEPLLDDQDVHQLKLLESSTVALNQLLKDVVALTGPDDELLPPRRQSFSLRDLLAGIRDVANPLADIHGFRIGLRGPEPDRRLGYPTALGQALLALASIPLRSGRPRSLEITADPIPQEPSRVLFTISSDVPGRDGETVAAVEAVSEGRATRDRTSMANLGLELAFRLVREMGSTLSVDSGDASRTRFTFVLELPPSESTPAS